MPKTVKEVTALIPRMRKEGLEKHLLNKAGGALWEAKRHLEDASKERFINFERELTAARKQIDDAEQLWRETYKL